MTYSIRDLIAEHITLPGDVSRQFGELLMQGYDISDVYIKYPENRTAMWFDHVKMSHVLLIDYHEAVIIMIDEED